MGLLIGNIDSSIIPDSVKDALQEDIPMYGVKFDSKNSVGVRTYDAADMKWTRSSSTVTGIDDFQETAPFKVRECCRIWDGTGKAASYIYKDAYSADEWKTIREGTHATINGDIMIEFSEFWYRRVATTNGGLEIIISPKYKVGFSPDPWHYRKGKHIEKRYISKYILSADYTSRSGLAPLQTLDVNTVRRAITDKGMYILDADAYYSIMMLLLVKYANLDVVSTISAGISTDYGRVVNSGLADSTLGLDGSPSNTLTKESCVTMGIENFYGNCGKFLDGIYCLNGSLYIKDVEDMATTPVSAAELSAYTIVTTNIDQSFNGSRKVTGVLFNLDYPYLLSTAGSAQDAISVSGYYTTAPTYAISWYLVGGNRYGGQSAGLFTLRILSTSFNLYEDSMGFMCIA